MGAGQRVAVGLDVALEEMPFGPARLGLVTHRAAVTADGRRSHEALLAAGARVVRLFAPEHGLDSVLAEGVEVGHGRDPATGLPVVSLYGSRRRPLPEDLDGLDALVIDLQDVGARCYTYLSTTVLAMDAAAAAGLPVWVLDRPNPIGGAVAEGIRRRPGFESFVGHLPIPLRHGLTFGELARWARPPGLELHVVAMRGWRRSMWWEGTGRDWVPPSPNIPDPDTALAYPGTVLLEGTEWSEGRGTDAPFRLVGDPVHPTRVQWDDRDRFPPVAYGLALLHSLCEREGPRWRPPDGRTLDLLSGSAEARTVLERGQSVQPLIERGIAEGAEFHADTRPIWMYEQ